MRLTTRPLGELALLWFIRREERREIARLRAILFCKFRGHYISTATYKSEDSVLAAKHHSADGLVTQIEKEMIARFPDNKVGIDEFHIVAIGNADSALADRVKLLAHAHDGSQ